MNDETLLIVWGSCKDQLNDTLNVKTFIYVDCNGEETPP